MIQSLYQKWSAPSQKLLEALDHASAAGYQIAQREAFRTCCREADAVGLFDEILRAPDRLTELRDSAVDDHRAGRTLLINSAAVVQLSVLPLPGIHAACYDRRARFLGNTSRLCLTRS